MADVQMPAADATPDQLLADFEKFLEATSSDSEAEPTPEPIPEPEPTPEVPPVPETPTEPAAVVARGDQKAETKVDGRTREGRKQSIQREIDDLSAQRHTTKAEVDAAKTELATLRAE